MDAGEATTIDLSGMKWPNLNFWSQALGGSVQVELSTDENDASAECTQNDAGTTEDWSDDTYDCTVADTTRVIFYAEDVVFPGDVIDEIFRLDNEKNRWGAIIPGGIIHTIVSLEPQSTFFEVKAGPFNPAAAKNFAIWAPEENSQEAVAYLAMLRNRAQSIGNS